MAKFDTELERILRRAEGENLPQPDVIFLNQKRFLELLTLCPATSKNQRIVTYREIDFVYDHRLTSKNPFQPFVKS